MVVNRLKDLRTTRQISQKDFAKRLGVSQQTVASWEVGRTEPANDALKNIADYFNVSTDYLLGRDDLENQPPLSGEQITLLDGFDRLNEEGKKAILVLIRQLNFGRNSETSRDERNYKVIMKEPVITVSP